MKIADNYLDNLTFVMYGTLAHLGSSEGFLADTTLAVVYCCKIMKISQTSLYPGKLYPLYHITDN